MSKKDYKFCDCDGPTCCSGRGPAVYSVGRDGKQMNVCTRCDLPDDEDRKLIIDKTYDADTLVRFDPLGAMSVMFQLQDEAPDPASEPQTVPLASPPRPSLAEREE